MKNVLIFVIFLSIFLLNPIQAEGKQKVWKETVRLQASMLPLSDGIKLAFKKEDWKTLLLLSDEGIKTYPTVPMGYFFKGIALYELGKVKKSVKYYTKAIELAPEIGDHYQNRGLSYIVLKKYNEALADSNKALELNPSDEYAKAQREWLLENIRTNDKNSR